MIPWDIVVEMRNKLIHGYDRVDLNILWDTVTDDLPRSLPCAGIIESCKSNVIGQ